MGAKPNKNLTFTLTNLLIAIVLMAIILSFFMVLTDPIEQANRARDNQNLAHASQVVTEMENFSNTHKDLRAVAFGYQKSTEFTVGDPIYYGKAEGVNSLIYACYMLFSKLDKSTACSEGNAFTLSDKTGVKTLVPEKICSTSTDWFTCVPNQ